MDTIKSFFQIVAILIAIVLILFNIYTGTTIQKIGLPGIVEFEFGSPPSQSTPPPDSLSPAASLNSNYQNPTSVATTEHSSECILTITNQLVPLMKEPKHFGQELIRVKTGEYPMLDYKVVNFGGLKDEGWFQIEVEGRSGWITDNIWTIASKTRACP